MNQVVCDDGGIDNRETAVPQGHLPRRIQCIPYWGENFLSEYSFSACPLWFTKPVTLKTAIL